MMMVHVSRLCLIISGLVVLCSCTPKVPTKAPILTPEQITRVPSPIPRAEPRSKYGNPESYVVFGKTYRVMESGAGYDQSGNASWYGPGFHEKLTSTRETYDMYAMTAAHKSLPIPCFVEVTNLKNGRTIVVRVNDRGPFVEGRIIDLSYIAASKLDMIEAGTAPVRVRALTTPGQKILNYEQLAAGDPGLARGALVNNVPLLPERGESLDQMSQITETPALYQQPITEWYVQVGAFGSVDNAMALQQKLSVQTGRTVSVVSDLARELEIVRVGPLANANEADSLKLELIRLGYAGPKIIRSE